MQKYDPIIEQHLIMAGGERSPPVESDGFPMMGSELEVGGKKIPLLVAVGLLGAVGGLFLFKLGGFKFVFGAKVGSA